MYREQTFVERCACDQPAVGPCASCGRARCALHLANGLCNRCDQAIGRELRARSEARLWIAWTLGVACAVIPLFVQSVIGLPLGVALAVTSYRALRRHDRRRLIARMGPALAASKGELPQPSRELTIEANPTNNPLL